jgi:hypothetical protein
MKPSQQPQYPPAQPRDSRDTAIRVAKWVGIVLIALFLITRVIRFFLQ